MLAVLFVVLFGAVAVYRAIVLEHDREESAERAMNVARVFAREYELHIGGAQRLLEVLAAGPARAVREVAQAAGLDEAAVKEGWKPLDFTVALNQSLLIAMENQARWANRRRLVEAAAVPNFLDWSHADALAAIKPDAVSVIN